MRAITDQLTNRDIALFAWLAVFVVFILAKRDIRSALWPLLHVLFLSRITPFLVGMVAYVMLVVFGGYKLGVWQLWMLKDTVYWFFGTAIATFVDINQAGKEEHYFKTAALRNLRFAAVLAFIINLYVFSLPLELLRAATRWA